MDYYFWLGREAEDYWTSGEIEDIRSRAEILAAKLAKALK